MTKQSDFLRRSHEIMLQKVLDDQRRYFIEKWRKQGKIKKEETPSQNTGTAPTNEIIKQKD